MVGVREEVLEEGLDSDALSGKYIEVPELVEAAETVNDGLSVL